MKSSVLKLVSLYIVSVIIYGIFAGVFSIPVHLDVDEELYISMARSFHYEGVFAKGGEVLNYSCILYSMLLSVAYFFYEPEYIMFALRMIGVVTMLSAVFPIFLLSKSILQDEKKAFVFSSVCLILPTFMNIAYCMQEVLSYPLFLWVCYFIYKEALENVTHVFTRKTFIISILCVLCYYTKTYMIFLPLVYLGLVFFSGWVENRIVAWRKIVLFGGIYCSLFILFEKLILLINNGIQGSNHYSSQFARLFPITGETIIAALGCMSVYFFALLFCWGVIPIILPAFNWNKHERKDQIFNGFLICCFLVLIVEIVISIVLTEEGNVFFPHKVLYRYFQILEIPFYLIFIKYYMKYHITSKVWLGYIPVFGMLGIYYAFIGTTSKTAIMDAPVFLLLENINRYLIPHFCVFALLVIALLIGGAYLLWKKEKIKNLLTRYLQLWVMILMVFFGINLLQLPLYTNVIANGKEIEEDGIQIAKYYIENQEKYSNIYFLTKSKESYGYERAVYAYMPKEVIFIEKMSDVVDSGIIISNDEQPLELPEAELVDLNLFSVYLH